MNLNLKLIPVDISPQESKGPIKLGIRNTEERTWNSEKFLTVDKNGHASVMIGNVPSKYQEDSNIWIEMFIKTKESYVRGGETNISYSELAASMRDKNMRKFQKDIIYHEMNGSPVKAKLLVDIEHENIGKGLSGSNMNLQPTPVVTPYQIIETNEKLITDVLSRNMTEAVNFMKMEPISDELNGVAAPYDQDNVTLPAKLYFVDKSWESIPHKLKANFFANALHTSLRRNDMSEDTFVKTVDGMWNGKDTNDFLKWKACKVVSDSTTLLSVSRPYLSDTGYLKGKQVGIENFQHTERVEALDPTSVAAGDCEDSARTILSIYHALQTHMSDFSSEPLLHNASRIANLYVPGACLSTVTGSQLADSEGNPIKVHIGDKVEKKLEIGAHMFVLAIPLAHFHGMLKEEDLHKCKVDAEVMKRKHLSSSLPHHVLEGTGTLSPNIFPYKSYFGDKENIDMAFKEHLDFIKGQIILSKGKPKALLNSAKLQKLPATFEDEEGMQPVFIRSLSDLFVPQFHETGDHFIFTNNGFNKRGAWLRNVCLRDTYIQGDRSYVEPRLYMSQREDQHAAMVYKNLEKQTPFSSGIYIEEGKIGKRIGMKIGGNVSGRGKEGRKTRADVLHEFNENVKKITKGRGLKVNGNSNGNGNGNNKDNSTKTMRLFYIHDDFIEGNTPELVLMDIKNNPDILEVESSFVPVDNFVHVVELEVKVDISSLKYKDEGKVNSNNNNNNNRSNRTITSNLNQEFIRTMNSHIGSFFPKSLLSIKGIKVVK